MFPIKLQLKRQSWKYLMFFGKDNFEKDVCEKAKKRELVHQIWVVLLPYTLAPCLWLYRLGPKILVSTKVNILEVGGLVLYFKQLDYI